MELRQLRYFQAVAEELHFGRAAERVHIAQPPLSQQIRRLEEELGVTLLRRTSRKVELTPEGARFLESARDILERVEGAVHSVRALARGEQGRLRVGFVGPASESLFPEAVRDFRSDWPDVRLVLREMGTVDQLEALRHGDIDVGVIRLFRQNLRGFSHAPFASEPYVLALPEGHPLAALDEVPLAALDGVPLVLFPRNYQPALYDTVMARLRQAGVRPNVVQQAITKQTTSALVASGLGAAFLHASSRKVARAGVAYRPLLGSFPLVHLEMVWRPERRTLLVQRFIRTLSGRAEGLELRRDPACAREL